MDKILQARLTKVNETTGEFWGIAAAETPDMKGEICDYEASKPLIKAWSDDIAAHSGGKSLGNLRAQHNSKVAVGRLLDIAFNDEAKTVEVHGEVVDAAELEKLAKGLYTGLSFGGGYGKKWRDNVSGKIRYAAKPIELSLADRPASSDTRFTLVKADGSEVEAEFAKVAKREDTDPKEGEDKYGDVKFADEKNKKYPIDTEKHIRAAWNYINKEKNAAKYSAEDLKTIKGKIVAAWKEKIDKDGPPAAEKVAEAGTMQKGLYSVGWFAQLLESVGDLVANVDWEAASEMDESPLPGQFKEWLTQGAEILKAMAAEEVDELVAMLTKVAEAGEMQKAGARHSKGDQEHIQAVHDHAVELGADCEGAEKVAKVAAPGETPVPLELEKVATERDEALSKLETQNSELEKVAAENSALKEEVEKLKAEPAPTKLALKEGLTAPGKEDDDPLNKSAVPKEPENPLEAMKDALGKPFIIKRA
jgi:hypothetical protein